jgi:glycogen(starch) synthase
MSTRVRAAAAKPATRQRGLRILVITARYPPEHLGGYDLRCRDIVHALVSRGHEVLILTGGPDGAPGRVETGIHRCLHREASSSMPQRITWDWLDLRRVDRAVRSFAPEVIYLFHVIELTRALFPFLARSRVSTVFDEGGIGLLTAWDNHGRWFSFADGPDRSYPKRAFRKVIAHGVSLFSGDLIAPRWSWPKRMTTYFNCEFNKKRHEDAGVPVRNNARVIHSGVDLKLFSFKAGRRTQDGARLVVPGRVVDNKGLMDALKAVHLLARVQPKPRLELEFVGPVQDEGYRRDLEKETERLGLKQNVTFSRMLPYEKMHTAYHGADFCLMLSPWESFSRILLEAMACGSVLITTAAGGGREIVRHGENAILVPGAAPERIADEVTKLLASDADYRRIQQSARRYVEENHDFASYVDKVEALLVEAAARRN